MEVATGLYKDISEKSDNDQWQVEAGLGMHQGQIDNVAEFDLWRNKLPILAELSDFLTKNSLKNALLEPIEDLEQARDELRSFLIGIRSFIELVEGSVGRGVYGLSGVLKIIRNLTISAQAILLLFWLSYRKTTQGKAALQNSKKIKKSLEPNLLAQEAFEDLRTEIPALAKILSPEYQGKAFLNKRTHMRYMNELKKLYEDNKNELEAFWQRHPEYNGLVPQD
jgi:hypothetical protein